VALVAPLREELAAILPRLQRVRRERRGSLRILRATLGGVALKVAVVGDGALRAAAGIEDLLAEEPLRGLLVVGVAGGLTRDLSACQVVVAERILSEGLEVPAPDRCWLERIEDLPRATLLSVPQVVAREREKEQLAARVGSTPAAVDLESAVLACAAARHQVPYVVLRSISDTLQESLPAFLQGCLRADGSLHRGRVLAALLRKPRRLRAVGAMGRRMRRCARALADAAECALQQVPL